MSGWAGLAAGAEFLGNQFKNQLQEKLLADREARAEARQQAREDRQEARELKKVAETALETDAEGATWKVRRNSRGEVLNRELASASEISAKNRAEEKEKLSLETAILNKQKLERESQYDIEDRPLEKRLMEARIGAENRQYTNYGRGGGSSAAAKPEKFTAPTKASLEGYMMDEDGETDPAKMKSFQQWRAANPDVRNGEEALSQWAAEQGAEESLGTAEREMRSGGLPEYLIRQKVDAMREGREDNTMTPTTKGFSPEQMAKYETGLKALQNARRLISAGKITKEEAQRQLRERGYPRLAEQIQ